MAKDNRFEKIYSQGSLSTMEIWVDKLTGFLLPDAGFHLGMVVEGHIEQAAYTAAGAALFVPGAVDHPGDPGIDDGAGAHGAGFQGHIQGAFPQPPAT